MADPFLGEIRMFAGNYAPLNWAFCDGQVLTIAQNSSLYSVIGCIYGGDERTVFNLPDMRGRTPLGARTGPGLSQYHIGQSGGLYDVTLSQSELPAHSHSMTADNENATAKNIAQPGASLTAKPNVARGSSYQLKNAYALPSEGQQVPMSSASISSTGAGYPHPNRQPCMAINFIICTSGVFPTRS
ncbi:phage tail protein [Desulforegula conservatrix]|uniref:phage tail protein n=1 Tax=Desulforegula conservatrix TaxID=153026 RepID=UPI00040F92D7|nr:tail fiber protein [Desulforegula conservatrix]